MLHHADKLSAIQAFIRLPEAGFSAGFG